MKIAAHVLAYNVTDFIGPVIRNLENQVDKIYVAYPERPFGYIQNSRDQLKNPTALSYIKNLAQESPCSIEIIQGDWAKEEDMRNACLKRAREEEFDWFIIQDADEFYTESTWKQIKNTLLKDKSHDHFITTWYNFWKSSQYVMTYKNGEIKGTNAGFAIRCDSEIEFIRKRVCNNEVRRVIDMPCYHYGYVMSDEKMIEKISTWSHANELFYNKMGWFKYKWLNWTESTRYLHPVHPDEWIQAIHFPFEQPDFANEFALFTNQLEKLKISDWAGEKIYNTKVNFYLQNKSLKRTAKIFLGKSL